MTFSELFTQTDNTLTKAGIEDHRFESVTLLCHFFHLTQAEWLTRRGQTVPKELLPPFEQAVRERTARRPLQYILGTWDFMNLEISVGEGVLIPRSDTEVLVNSVSEWIQKQPHREALCGMDLCAGSGAVSLGLCALHPDLRMTAAELSESAFFYLCQNTDSYAEYDIMPVKGNVLLDTFAFSFDSAFDFIAANPPYIQSCELPMLQPEVQKEPEMALNGGNSGLSFYEGIIPLWKAKLKSGGLMAFEIGDTQAAAVSGLLRQHGFTGLSVRKDLAGLDRVVFGIKS